MMTHQHHEMIIFLTQTSQLITASPHHVRRKLKTHLDGGKYFHREKGNFFEAIIASTSKENEENIKYINIVQEMCLVLSASMKKSDIHAAGNFKLRKCVFIYTPNQLNSLVSEFVLILAKYLTP